MPGAVQIVTGLQPARAWRLALAFLSANAWLRWMAAVSLERGVRDVLQERVLTHRIRHAVHGMGLALCANRGLFSVWAALAGAQAVAVETQ